MEILRSFGKISLLRINNGSSVLAGRALHGVRYALTVSNPAADFRGHDTGRERDYTSGWRGCSGATRSKKFTELRRAGSAAGKRTWKT